MRILLILSQERLVLAILYYATGGDEWTSNSGWLDATHHDTWFGVTTDSSTNSYYVSRLDLSDNELTGPIPTQFGQLTTLEKLSLYNNKLTGSIPSTKIGQLTSLEYLSLSDNELTGPIPTQIGQLTSLEKLYLYNNKLTGSIPTKIGQLTSLEWLFLNNNELTGPIPKQIGQLVTSLKSLSLSHNEVTGPVPDGVCDLPKTRNLWADCDNCNLSKPDCCNACF